jgi:hypothetical protein
MIPGMTTTEAGEALAHPVVGILQPSYLPWLGAFALMSACDVWVFYDDVQYTRRDWRNRNRIKTARGPETLTVPVSKPARDATIAQVRIHPETDWAKSHLAKLRTEYRGCPQREETLALLEPVLLAGETGLSTLCCDLTRALAERLEIRPRFVLASELAVAGRGQERILALCRKLGAASYVNGAAGRELYEPESFAELGIALAFQDYRHPEYDQPHPPFASHLSVVDLLMSHPPAEARRILDGGARLEAAP